MAEFKRTLSNTVPLDRNGNPIAVMAGFDPVTETAVPLRVAQSAGGDWISVPGTAGAELMGAVAVSEAAAAVCVAGGTKGTSISDASPAIATTAGDTLELALNGEVAQTITLATSATGAAVAADIQAKVRALTAASAANQSAYTAFTCAFTTVYTLSSGKPGTGSAVVVSTGTTATALKLGVADGGTEAVGLAKSGIFGHRIWNTGAKTAYLGFDNSVTSSTGISLAAGANMTLDGVVAAYTGPIWAVCAAGETTTLRGVAYL